MSNYGNIITEINRDEVRRISAQRELPEFSPGDVICVVHKFSIGKRERTQRFEGICISRKGNSIGESFTVRKITHGEGVERLFPLHSPSIVSIEVLRRGRPRRAKLYYLRLRQGRSLKIPERIDRGAHNNLQPGNSDGLRAANRAILRDTMLNSIAKIERLEGEPEGAQTRAAMRSIVYELSRLTDGEIITSDLFELGLTLGNFICPFLASNDMAVAQDARRALAALGRFISHDRNVFKSSDELIRTLFDKLEVSAIFNVAVCVRDKTTLVDLTVRDVLDLAHPSVCNRQRSFEVGLKIKDFSVPESTTVGFGRVAQNHPVELSYFDPDGKSHDGMHLLSIIFDGNEVLQSKMDQNFQVVFSV